MATKGSRGAGRGPRGKRASIEAATILTRALGGGIRTEVLWIGLRATLIKTPRLEPSPKLAAPGTPTASEPGSGRESLVFGRPRSRAPAIHGLTPSGTVALTGATRPGYTRPPSPMPSNSPPAASIDATHGTNRALEPFAPLVAIPAFSAPGRWSQTLERGHPRTKSANFSDAPEAQFTLFPAPALPGLLQKIPQLLAAATTSYRK